jgi:hypothetical protein
MAASGRARDDGRAEAAIAAQCRANDLVAGRVPHTTRVPGDLTNRPARPILI